MASRALYKALAESYRIQLRTAQRNGDTSVTIGIAETVRMTASVLKHDNPAFRYDYFYAACGLDEWGYTSHERAERAV